jgi:hypothetical protein
MAKVTITYSEAENISGQIKNLNNEDVAIKEMSVLANLHKVTRILSPHIDAVEMVRKQPEEFKAYLEGLQKLRQNKATKVQDLQKYDDDNAEVLQRESARRVSLQNQLNEKFSIEIPDIKESSIEILKPAGLNVKAILDSILIYDNE